MTWDILIRGGTLYDGSSRPGERGDVAIADGRIAQIRRDLSGPAERVIDAAGLAVTPGFIDIKTHSDFTLPINPKAESKVRQGVTTEIIGHCGFSVAPCLPGKVQVLADYLSGGAPWLPVRETSFPDYLDTFPAVAVNAGMLVGHNTLRLMVLGLEDRAPSAAELDQMCGLLEEGLGAGALGLSTGFFTPPGSFAEPAEIMALCAVVAQHKAAYFTHIRDESNRMLEAVEEAIAVARAYPIHVEIVHLKCSGVDNWGKAAEILDRLDRARREGCDIDCDAYPYTAGANPLKNLLPPWVLVGADGNCVADYGVVGQGMPHPRFYGTFPRVIGHYVGEERLIPLERAVHKMTGGSAAALKLRDRGLLKEGWCADIAVFDPADFTDQATYAEPHRYPSGARTTVIVNGVVVVEHAKHTGALPGRVLRRGVDGTAG